MDETPNLKLPYLLAAQAQKHVTHNEALRALDVLAQPFILDRDLTAPPASPVDGDGYIVAAGATGAWVGKENQIAAFQDNAWIFHPPKEGWICWVGDEDELLAFDGSIWVIAGGGSVNPTPLVGVNATADLTNRLSISSPATLFNHEGTGHRLKVNKNAASDTASVLFQTGFSGRAEFGLAGDDDWHVKVSPDGASWKEALVVNKNDGGVSIGQELVLPDGVKISNKGTTNNAGVEIEGGGIFGKVAMTVQSVSGMTGVLFEQRSQLGPGLDLIDFALKTLSQQLNLRAESRAAFAHTGGTPEFQIVDSTIVPTTEFMLAISPKQCILHVPFVLKNFTVATLPGASTVEAGALAFISDESGGAVPAFSDGTNWRRMNDRAIVS